MADALDLAQASIVGRLMNHPDEAAEIFARLRIIDFYGNYREMAQAIHDLRVKRHPFDAMAVAAELERASKLEHVGGYSEVMRVNGFGFADAEFQIDLLVNAVRLRRLASLGYETEQAAAASDADAAAVVKMVQDRTQDILDGIEAEGDVATLTAGEFVAVEDAPHDWVIPNLLERSDRLILTGSEGLGKSVLFRQLAVCAAAGIDPFTHREIEPQRVLLIDCENGPTKIRRALRGLLDVARRYSDQADKNLFIESRPEGLDLTRPEDELWLIRHVTALQPALLLTGPLYRLHAANPNEEQPARDVTRVLDRCRAIANCALVTEAHAGHGYGGEKRPIRPTGTSLWLRWPEFGYGLRQTEDYSPDTRVVEFMSWRGDREERAWPTRLRAGVPAGSPWPWVVATDPNREWSPSRGVA